MDHARHVPTIPYRRVHRGSDIRKETDLREQLEWRRKERGIERLREELKIERQRDKLMMKRQRQEREIEQLLEELEQERRRKEREGATKLRMRIAAPPQPSSPALTPSVHSPMFHDRGLFLSKGIIQAAGPIKTRLMYLIRVV